MARHVAFYVDYLFLVGRRLERIKEVKGGLPPEFKIKDLGEEKFLSIEIYRNQEAKKWGCLCGSRTICSGCGRTFQHRGVQVYVNTSRAGMTAGHFSATNHRCREGWND